MAQMTTLTATIARVNDHGFQTQEEPGRWFNVSKYASPAPVIPPKGTPVTLTLDGSGFIRAIEPVSSATASNGHEPHQDARPAAPGRETVITRLACLKAAAAFLATRPDAKSTDVLRVAESWEEWTQR
jgi:hypothetical protein